MELTPIAFLSTAPVYVAVLGLLWIILTLRVGHYRNRNKINLGDGGDPELQRRIRGQGNFVESAPLAVVLLIVMGLPGHHATAGETPEVFPSPKYPDYPFSEAVSYGGVLYLSGDIGAGSDGKLIEGGIGPESRQTMDNIKATLGRHGLGMEDIIKCTVFLADIAEWPEFNKVYADYFEKGRYPARSALAASGLALGARVEVECIAAAP